MSIFVQNGYDAYLENYSNTINAMQNNSTQKSMGAGNGLSLSKPENDSAAPALDQVQISKEGLEAEMEEWRSQHQLEVNWDKVVDPDGKIYGAAYVQSILEQYQCAENAIREYYSKEHQANLAKPTITDGLNYLSLKYTKFGLDMGSPHYRSEMSEAEREMAFRQEKAMLLGGCVTLGDPYALASRGGTLNIEDVNRIAKQAARDKIDELIRERRVALEEHLL